MSKKEIKTFVKERNKILMNIDTPNLQEIKAHCYKWGVQMPEDEIVILAGLHKARLYVTSKEITDEMKNNSRIWLLSHGFSLEILGDKE